MKIINGWFVHFPAGFYFERHPFCYFVDVKVETFIFLYWGSRIKGCRQLSSLRRRRRAGGAMFLIINLTWEQRAELNGPACCLFLLVALRLHCFAVTSYSVLVYFAWDEVAHTLHANQKLWFMHLSRGEWNIKFNFAAVELCPRRAQAWHGEPGLPPPRRNSLLPPQYAKATFEWNICLVSDPSSVYSLYTDS